MAKESLETGPSSPSLSPEPSQLGQQLPHVSCEPFKGDFPKRKSFHPTPPPPRLMYQNSGVSMVTVKLQIHPRMN